MAEARQDCRRQALDLLGRREHSRVELARKLKARSHADDVVTTTLDELAAEGLLANDRFSEAFVRTRVGRGQGPVRIRLELARHGIDDCDAWLGSDDYDWPALAGRARVKRFGPALPASFAERAKQARFLEYRGFERDQIAHALEFGDDSD